MEEKRKEGKKKTQERSDREGMTDRKERQEEKIHDNRKRIRNYTGKE